MAKTKKVKTTYSDIIMEALATHPASTSNTLAEFLGMIRGTVSGRLTTLSQIGKVDRIKRGQEFVYSVAKAKPPTPNLDNLPKTAPGQPTKETAEEHAARIEAMIERNFVPLPTLMARKIAPATLVVEPAAAPMQAELPMPYAPVSLTVTIDGKPVALTLGAAKSLWRELGTVFAA